MFMGMIYTVANHCKATLIHHCITQTLLNKISSHFIYDKKNLFLVIDLFQHTSKSVELHVLNKW